MIEFDRAVRTALVDDRVAALAAAWGEPRRPSVRLRRRLGLALVSLGLRVAGSCPQGASPAAYSSVA